MEIVSPVGGPWGAAKVNKNFETLLRTVPNNQKRTKKLL